jgi:hypothetical protein
MPCLFKKILVYTSPTLLSLLTGQLVVQHMVTDSSLFHTGSTVHGSDLPEQGEQISRYYLCTRCPHKLKSVFSLHNPLRLASFPLPYLITSFYVYFHIRKKNLQPQRRFIVVKKGCGSVETNQVKQYLAFKKMSLQVLGV